MKQTRRRTRPLTRKKTHRSIVGSDPDAPNDDQWESFQQFGSFIVRDEDGVEHTFKKGDNAAILPFGVNVGDPLELHDYWVGKIRDIRMGQDDVWTRVQWYWSGREVHQAVRSFEPAACGRFERIFSDHFDYVHTSAIDAVVPMLKLSDANLDQPFIPRNVFFTRYTFEYLARVIQPKPGNDTCICNVPYSPDVFMPPSSFSSSANTSDGLPSKSSTRKAATNTPAPLTLMHFCPRPSCRRFFHAYCLLKAGFFDSNPDDLEPEDVNFDLLDTLPYTVAPADLVSPAPAGALSARARRLLLASPDVDGDILDGLGLGLGADGTGDAAVVVVQGVYGSAHPKPNARLDKGEEEEEEGVVRKKARISEGGVKSRGGRGRGRGARARGRGRSAGRGKGRGENINATTPSPTRRSSRRLSRRTTDGVNGDLDMRDEEEEDEKEEADAEERAVSETLLSSPIAADDGSLSNDDATPTPTPKRSRNNAAPSPQKLTRTRNLNTNRSTPRNHGSNDESNKSSDSLTKLNKILSTLPPELVRIAQQPIVRGAAFDAGGVSGNVGVVVKARRMVYEVVSAAAVGSNASSLEGWREILGGGVDAAIVEILEARNDEEEEEQEDGEHEEEIDGDGTMSEKQPQKTSTRGKANNAKADAPPPPVAASKTIKIKVKSEGKGRRTKTVEVTLDGNGAVPLLCPQCGGAI